MLNPEHVLIPFEVSPLPTGPWLVFAPHADDETFGMGGSLLKAREEGIETHVVVVTDGALGGDTEDLVAVRRGEVKKATDMLGVNGLHCWSEPDRGVEVSDRLVEKTLAIIEQTKAAAVFFPAPLEIHPDHRATALLVWAALQAAQQRQLNPEIIAYEIGNQSPVNLFIDITELIGAKDEVMAVYCSQNSENNYPELVLSLDKGRTFSLPDGVEYAEGFYRFAPEDLGSSLQQVTHRIIDLYQ